MKLKFLILGAHGDIGISIFKILNQNFKNSIIEGCDVKKRGMGDFFFEKVYHINFPGKGNYVKQIKNLSKKYDLIIPTNENEIYYLSRTKLGIFDKLLINNKSIINKFRSKIDLNDFIKNYNSNYSFSVCEPLSKFKIKKKKTLPIFLKKNIGSGNKNYKLIKKIDEIKKVKSENLIVQDYLDEKYEEFTAGIFRTKTKTISIIFKRILHPFGFTYYAKVYRNKKIKIIIEDIANKINLKGSINIQFKKKGGDIKIFDLNTRLSSTVLFRDMLGFKDLVWWIKFKLGKNFKINFDIQKVKNKKIYKFYDEKAC